MTDPSGETDSAHRLGRANYAGLALLFVSNVCRDQRNLSTLDCRFGSRIRERALASAHERDPRTRAQEKPCRRATYAARRACHNYFL